MSELGNLLQQRRLEKKLTLKEISSQTKIKELFLQLLEEGRFSELPSYVHAYGFLKNYSEYLGFNFNEEIEPLFTEEYPKQSDVPVVDESEFNKKSSDVHPSDFSDDNGKNGHGNGVVIFLAVIVIIGVVFYVLYRNGIINSSMFSSNSSAVINTSNKVNPVVENEIQPVTNDNITDNITDNESSSSDNVSEIVPVEEEPAFVEGNNDNSTMTYNVIKSEPEKVIVKFNDRCWFKYGTDLGVVRDLTAINGTVIEFEFNKNFQISIGNAAAVTLEYNGRKYTNFGRKNMARLNLVYKAVNGSLELQKR